MRGLTSAKGGALLSASGLVMPAQRLRAAALPYLDDLSTLARYLLRDAADAEAAAQECYLRAFRHFDTFRGGPIKPWLLAILRNVCRAEYARRSAVAAMISESLDSDERHAEGLWSEGEASPEAATLQQFDAGVVQRCGATSRQTVAFLQHSDGEET
jgi:RNA polymerase sigma-70 factor, ECF subfamily